MRFSLTNLLSLDAGNLLSAQSTRTNSALVSSDIANILYKCKKQTVYNSSNNIQKIIIIHR